MGKAEFDRFVKRQQAAQAEAAGFDAEKERLRWLGYLGNLHAAIQGYLEDYLKSGAATIEFEDVQLNEEMIGEYTARQLNLTIGQSTITFKPVGTFLIGSRGRVDVQGPRGAVRLGLFNRKAKSPNDLIRITTQTAGEKQAAKPPTVSPDDIDWAWKIITIAPNAHFEELTQNTFFDLILSVADA